jgi:curved DNA-binding protein
MAAPDLYATLGVSREAKPEEIRSAYRKLARKHHPDLNPGDKKAEEQFKRIAAAYEVLSDPEKRKLYDEFGEQGIKGGFDPEQARQYRRWQEARRTSGAAEDQPFDFELDVDDLRGFGDLGDLFGAARGRGRRGPVPRRGQDVVAEVPLDFGTALKGTMIDVTNPVSGEQSRIRIPPGSDEGSELRVRGKGAPGRNGGPPGDLIIRTRVRPHPHFRREGLDLHLKLPVTIAEAYAGTSVDVPTPDGPVRLKIPPRTQQGARLRLREKGVAREGRRGDLYVEIDVRLPDRDDAALAEALAGTDRLYDRPVREGITL